MCTVENTTPAALPCPRLLAQPPFTPSLMLPLSAGEDEVRNQLTDAFGAAGTVVNVRLPTDRESGELKGIGFVEFDSADAKVSASRVAAHLQCTTHWRCDVVASPPKSRDRRLHTHTLARPARVCLHACLHA